MSELNLPKNDVQLVEKLKSSYTDIKNEISKVIVGQDEIISNILISIFSKGHSLLVGVPGLAKTLLVKTIADVLDLKFSRIQFTPDLMPGDITGTEIVLIGAGVEPNEHTKDYSTKDNLTVGVASRFVSRKKTKRAFINQYPRSGAEGQE